MFRVRRILNMKMLYAGSWLPYYCAYVMPENAIHGLPSSGFPHPGAKKSIDQFLTSSTYCSSRYLALLTPMPGAWTPLLRVWFFLQAIIETTHIVSIITAVRIVWLLAHQPRESLNLPLSYCSSIAPLS